MKDRIITRLNGSEKKSDDISGRVTKNEERNICKKKNLGMYYEEEY